MVRFGKVRVAATAAAAVAALLSPGLSAVGAPLDALSAGTLRAVDDTAAATASGRVSVGARSAHCPTAAFVAPCICICVPGRTPAASSAEPEGGLGLGRWAYLLLSSGLAQNAVHARMWLRTTRHFHGLCLLVSPSAS